MRPRILHRRIVAATALLLFAQRADAQTSPVAQALPYSFTALSGTTLPAGMAAHRFGTTSGAVPTSRTTAICTGDLPNGTGTTGGWAAQTTSGISLLASNAQAAGAIVVAINTQNRTGIEVSWVARTILQQASRDNSIALQYRVGPSGTWTDVGSGTTYSSQGQTAGSDSGPLSEFLPVEAENEPVVQVRWIYWESNGTSGSRDRMGIDEISITGVLDSDHDGDPDSTDPCPLLANMAPGYGCDDGNANTINDVITAGCTCTGVVENDDCASALDITNHADMGGCPSGGANGNTSGATASGGSCGTSNNDVWYRFYSHSSLSAQVMLTQYSATGVGIEVFEDACGGSSVYCASGILHTVPVTPNQYYRVRVFTATDGTFGICVSYTQQPSNDECSYGQFLNVYSIPDCPTNSYPGTTVGASSSGGSCASTSNDVWFYFYGSSSLATTITLTPGSAIGLGVEVFNDVDVPCSGSSMYCAAGDLHEVPTVAGLWYSIRVFSSTPGDFGICLSSVPQPANDECASATGLSLYNYADCPINGTSGTTIGSAASGTNSCVGGSPVDVWYTVYTYANTEVFLSLSAGTASGLGVEVFDGCGGNVVYCASGLDHTVPVLPNSSYYIKVSSATAGDFSICASQPVGNNECAYATNLGLQAYADCPVNATAGTTVAATQSGANSCAGGATQDVWYYVYSYGASSIFVNLGSVTATGIGIEVFDGCGGNMVYCASGTTHTVPVALSTYYYIKVFSTAAGDFTICTSQPVGNNECDYATSLGLQAYADCPVNATAGTTVAATQSGTNSCVGGATQDVWYYVYSYSGTSIFVDLGSVTATGIGIEVFDGCGGNMIYCASGTAHTVPVMMSTYYYIKVFSTAPGDFTICTSTPVGNNECPYATSLGLQAYADCPVNATAGTTVAATQSGTNSCVGGATQDVWYYVYSYSGTAIFVDLGSVTATGIGIEVFDGCDGNVVYCASGSAHTVPVTMSTYYYIKVFSTAPGDFTICTSTPVANNECDYATALTVQNDGDCPMNAITGTTVASTQSGVNGCNGSASYDVWYYFYVGNSASVIVNIAQTGATGVGVEVFGACGGTPIYCASGASHTVAVTPNQTYWAKVFSTGAGTFDICVNYPPPVYDCLGVLGGSALPGTACTDGNACTTGDTWNNSCQCIGTLLPDGDGDGLCDAQDNCPTVTGQVGSGCDDGNPCTMGDALNGSCVCAGTSAPDSDGDGTCDGLDPCPYLANLNNGDLCDDGNASTTGDVVSGCVCSGVVSTGGITMAANWPHVNGTVRAIAHDQVNDVVYIGGDFTRVGAQEAYGAKVNTSDGQVDYSFANPNGDVRVAVPDGAGGWYIGGSFTRIGGVVRNRVARINADGSLHAWNPNASGGVTDIVLSGSTVYLGGAFSSVGGQARQSLAAVDANTGVPTSWNPGAFGSVFSLALNGTTLYLGGFLTSVGGQPRTNAGAVSTVTGLVTAWNPAPDNAVMAMQVAGGVVYAGGQFTAIGGQSRTALAALNATTGVATAWNPTVVGSGGFASVNALALYAGELVVCGQYSQIGGAVRPGIARLNLSTAVASAWNPNPAGGGVLEMSISGNSAYIAGHFSGIGGQIRRHAAEVDLVTAAISAWDPAPGSSVNAICRSGSAVFIGGTFACIGGTVRNNIAAINGATGQLLPWNPSVTHPSSPAVYDVHLSGDSLLYIAGQFTAVGASPRQHLAAIRTSDGMANGWAPNANTLAFAITRDGNNVYVGGSFTTTGGQARDRIACLNSLTGLATSWNPGANSNVIDLAIQGDTLFAGGSFTTLGGVAKGRLGALSRSTGSTLGWTADVDGFVLDLALQGTQLYVAGSFATIGGQSRSNIASVDRVSGAVTPWNPSADGQVGGVDVHGSGVYAGGGFGTIGGQSRLFLASVDNYSAQGSSWLPQASGFTVETVLVSGDRLFVGGSFNAMALQPRGGIAAFDLPASGTSRLAARAHLDGPYNSTTGLMGDAVRNAGLLPISEPYSAMGYAHTGGGGSEFTTPSVLGVTGSNAIVDWVLLELRDNANSSNVVATRAALVQRDGDVVDVDGVSPVSFNVAPGNYYVSVRHRNHLGCMTSSAVALSATPVLVDYTTLATSTYGTNARKTSGGAVAKQLLWAGDVTFNHAIKYTGSGNDRDPLLVKVGSTTPNNTVNGYWKEDVNMNGVVKYTGSGNDRDPVLVNVGSTTPNATRTEQLP